ncbi:hypothetical protein FQN52_009088 [Onygenales sp. PD_12]|nr:hypothetical protein FQN52_009088 [Onygenales sp. PD_12]
MASTQTKSNEWADEKGISSSPSSDVQATVSPVEDEDAPTEEERATLRRIPGKIPSLTYLVCMVEFAERASYYGTSPLISNFVNRPMPVGGNGYGAPPRGDQQTTGALGLGSVKANAVNQSFSMLAYGVPLIFGYIADVYTGRFKLICWGIAVVGIAHVLLVGSAAPSLLASGNAMIPYFLSLYILSIGTAMFKPNIAPLLLDQNKHTTVKTKVLENGEKVIVDPEATSERIMTWFYMMINIGGMMGIPTAYASKHGFWESAKPSVIAARGQNIPTRWNDQFVDDVSRTFQAAGIFCFFPIQYLNDNGIGQAASFTSTMLTTNGVPNDVISNFNSLSIIAFAPIVNYGLYPLVRRMGFRYGPVARITTGLAMSTIGGLGYTLLNYYAYKVGPCGEFGSSDTCVDENGVAMVAPITIWWIALPYALGGISELFINIPAYGIAYSHAPQNMRGLLMALNLFSSSVAYIIGLACSAVIKDPYLTWDFGGTCIAGGILTVVFYFLFRHIDQEEYRLSENDDYHGNGSGSTPVVTETAADS